MFVINLKVIFSFLKNCVLKLKVTNTKYTKRITDKERGKIGIERKKKMKRKINFGSHVCR